MPEISSAGRSRSVQSTDRPMRVHILQREQRLAPTAARRSSRSSPTRFNLEAIDPAAARLRGAHARPDRDGRRDVLIHYRLRLHGMRLGWLTEIHEWTRPSASSTPSSAAPTRVWHHTHEFDPLPGGGTLMRDTVRYRPALGPLGELALPLVRRDLAAIFDFRRVAGAACLPAGSPAAAALDGGEPVEDQVGAGQVARASAPGSSMDDAVGSDDHQRPLGEAAVVQHAEGRAGGALGLEVRQLGDRDAELLAEGGLRVGASHETPRAGAPRRRSRRGPLRRASAGRCRPG